MAQTKISPGGKAIIFYHTFLLLTLPFYFYYAPPSLSTFLFTTVLFFASGLGITAGYHRFYSHKSYKMNPIAESVLLFFGSMAAQGSALRWSYDHRLHHAYVDTDKDPYSVKKGFWYAHLLWMMEENKPIDPKVVPDLLKNKRVVFQDKYYGSCVLFSNLAAFLLTFYLLQDALGAFFLCIWCRLLVLHHCTWCINSLAHTWGSKTFSKEHSAVDNYLISLLTFGEGYHNYHHTFANDYRNGIRWYNFDPTKWLIWSLQKCHLAWDLKRIDLASIKKRQIQEDKLLLMQRIKELIYVKKDLLELQVQEAGDRLSKQITQLQNLVRKYQDSKREASKEQLQSLKKQVREMKRSLKQDWKNWLVLSNQIMSLQPLCELRG